MNAEASGNITENYHYLATEIFRQASNALTTF